MDKRKQKVGKKQKYRYLKKWRFPDNFKYSCCIEDEYDYDHRGEYGKESTILNERVVSVDIDGLVRYIVNSHNRERLPVSTYNKEIKKEERNSKFFYYCVDRLARIYKAYNPDNWGVLKSRGYYGEEIDGYCFDNYKFRQAVDMCYSMSPDEKILFILEQEYGYILERLDEAITNGKTFQKIEVPLSELRACNREYVKKVEPDIYSNYNGVLGVYIFDGQNYLLIDGYHRYVSQMRTDNFVPNKKVEIIALK